MTDQPTTFRQLVAAMRQAQKAYYREKTQSNLKAALKLEMRVDVWLNRHRDELAEQAELLEDDDDRG